MANKDEVDAQILAFLALNDSAAGLAGYEIMKGIGRPTASGIVYPSISRLQRAGSIERRLQDEPRWPITGRDATVKPVAPGARARTYYRITPQGRDARAAQVVSAKGNRRRTAPAKKLGTI